MQGGSYGDLHAHAYLGVRVTRVHYLDCLCLLLTICLIKKNKMISKSVLLNREKTSWQTGLISLVANEPKWRRTSKINLSVFDDCTF